MGSREVVGRLSSALNSREWRENGHIKALYLEETKPREENNVFQIIRLYLKYYVSTSFRTIWFDAKASKEILQPLSSLSTRVSWMSNKNLRIWKYFHILIWECNIFWMLKKYPVICSVARCFVVTLSNCETKGVERQRTDMTFSSNAAYIVTENFLEIFEMTLLRKEKAIWLKGNF